MLNGKPVYCYNLLGAQRFKVVGEKTVEPGEHQIRAEFSYDGGGLGKGGTVTLYLEGENVGEGRVEATQPMIFSCDETTDLGSDTATSVTDDLTSAENEVHRPRRMGADRRGRRRRGCRPLHHPGRTTAYRHGDPVMSLDQAPSLISPERRN